MSKTRKDKLDKWEKLAAKKRKLSKAKPKEILRELKLSEVN